MFAKIEAIPLPDLLEDKFIGEKFEIIGQNMIEAFSMANDAINALPIGEKAQKEIEAHIHWFQRMTGLAAHGARVRRITFSCGWRRHRSRRAMAVHVFSVRCVCARVAWEGSGTARHTWGEGPAAPSSQNASHGLPLSPCTVAIRGNPRQSCSGNKSRWVGGVQ